MKINEDIFYYHNTNLKSSDHTNTKDENLSLHSRAWAKEVTHSDVILAGFFSPGLHFKCVLY